MELKLVFFLASLGVLLLVITSYSDMESTATLVFLLTSMALLVPLFLTIGIGAFKAKVSLYKKGYLTEKRATIIGLLLICAQAPVSIYLIGQFGKDNVWILLPSLALLLVTLTITPIIILTQCLLVLIFFMYSFVLDFYFLVNVGAFVIFIFMLNAMIRTIIVYLRED